MQKITSGFITSAWQDKMEVGLDKRVKRKTIEINKILFKPPSHAMTAVRPRKAGAGAVLHLELWHNENTTSILM